MQQHYERLMSLDRILSEQLDNAEPGRYEQYAPNVPGPQPILRVEPLPMAALRSNPVILRERVDAAIAQLDGQLNEEEAAVLALSRTASDEYRNRLLGVITATKDGQDLKDPIGVHVDTGWAYDIVSAWLENKPMTVWGHDVLPSTIDYSAKPSLDFFTGKHVYPQPPANYGAMWESDRAAAYQIVKLLWMANPNDNMRVQFLVPNDSSDYYKDLRTDFASHFLTSEGLFDPTARSGNVGLARLTDYQGEAKEFVQRLAHSRHGVLQEAYGQLDFLPAPWLQRWMQLQYPSYIDRNPALYLGPAAHYEPEGHIHLSNAPFAALIEQSTTQSNMNVVIGTRQDLVVGGLLRAMDAIHRNEYHTIGAKKHFVGEQYPAFQIGHMLRRELLRYAGSLRRFVTANEIDFDSYANKNYLKEVMAQDKEIMRTQLAAEPAVMKDLGIDLSRPETLLKDYEAVHVCVGSNMYPIALRHRLSSGVVLGIDLSPGAAKYMNRVKEGHHHKEWAQHEDEIVLAARELGMDAGAFRGSMEAAANKLHVMVGNVRHLPERAFRHVQMHFGAEATGPTRTNCYQIMSSIAGALREDGIFEGVFTMNSGPWSDNVNELGAASMSENDYELMLLDSGFEIIERKIIGAELPEDTKVRPGEDFIYFRCRLRK